MTGERVLVSCAIEMEGSTRRSQYRNQGCERRSLIDREGKGLERVQWE